MQKKNSLLDEFTCNVVDKSYVGIIGLQLDHRVSDYRCLIYCCYLSPENSHWGRDSVSFYTHLLSQIYMYSDEADSIIVCGDLNGRIGGLDDYIPSVDNIPERKHGNTLIQLSISMVTP